MKIKTTPSQALLVLCFSGIAAFAVETRSWQQAEMAEFEKGKLAKLSLRNDGRLSPAPVVKELLDASTSYLWAVAQDSKGNLYVGGGSANGGTEKLIQVDPGGKSKTVAELDGLEIHAIAVDQKDNVYAATSPDGKVYRLRGGTGKPEVFYDPKAKYIWALAFSSNGDLFIATGDKGELHRVKPDGKGSVFFKADETHIRSIAIDAQGNIIAGTEPGGLILRVGANGEGFVLFQSPKREVTAVAVAADGAIWAAAIGNKGGGGPVIPAPAAAPASAPSSSGAVVVQVSPSGPRPAASPAPPSGAPAIAGGTEVYRIQPDGFPRRVWQHASDIVYSMAFDAAGKPLLASGNRGNLYRLDSDHQYTLLVTLAPTQITSVAIGKGGALYAVTGNIGKLFQVGPQIESQGTLESDVFDVGAFSYWGRLSFYSAAPAGLKFETRSGNLSTPQKNWSNWAPVTIEGKRGRVTSPAARFLQYRATLSGPNAELTGVDIAYQAKNIAPTIEEIEVTPPNYRFPAPSVLTSLATPSAATLSLPALGQRRLAAVNPADLNTGVTMNYAKGHIGVRWLARDDNGDTLTFQVEIRGVRESEWKLLKDKLRDRYFSWDTAAFADGEYLVRVTANDSASNTPQNTLQAVRETDTFLVDNTGPKVTPLTARLNGSKLEIEFQAKDEQSIITKAEYSINGGEWIVAEPSTRLSDSSELQYRLSVDKPAGSGSEFTIAVRVTDEFDNQTVEKAVTK